MIKNRLVRLLTPTIVGLISYYIVYKLFPNESKRIDTFSEKNIRGGDNALYIKILDRIYNDNALKIGLIALFGTAGAMHFKDELVELLSNAQFLKLCNKEEKLINNPLCTLISKYELDKHTISIRKLILDNELDVESKIRLLTIKLGWIIRGEYAGKKRSLLIFLIGVIIAASLTGTGGLALMLEALYNLFKSGKLDEATYTYLKEYITYEDFNSN